MKKVVRDIKRGVNKKVLKVPGIEQKVLDATSNEGWGPHAISLGDIAQASRNYHDYQIIMSVIWKRINDTGKNWRHVYKALTVLEYLVANGSERVVYDIREHAYQISTLSDFQYTDSSGKDQGLNVRRKSQNLVALVNDKELISEVRQKAASNRDKYGSAPTTGGSNRPGGYGDKYDANVHDGRHGSKDDHGYGREKETGYRSDDHNSRNGDSQSHDGDWNSADHGERNGRDSNRQDDHQSDSRSRSSDADSQRSSQGMARRFSEQNLAAPPSYEEAVTESQIPEHSKRDSETQSTSAPTHSSPTISNSGSSPKDGPDLSAPHVKQDFASFDEFDPRGSVQATTASTAANNAEVDLLGFSDPFDSNPLAITQAASTTTVPEPLDPGSNGMELTFGAAAFNFAEQSFEDPFGDSPFKALPSSESTAPTPSAYEVAMNESNNHHHPQMSGQEGTVPHFDFGNYAPSDSQFPSHDQSNPDEEIDILADILPLTGPPPVSAPQTSFSAPPGHSTQSSDHFYGDFSLQGGNPSSPFSALAGLPSQTNDGSHGGDYSSKAQTAGSPFSATSGPPAQSSEHFNSDFHSQATPFSAPRDQYTNDFGDFGALAVVQAQNGEQFNQGSIQQQTGAPPSPFDAPSSDPPHPSPNNYEGFGSQAGLETPVSAQMLPQAQNGMGMHFDHESGTSLPFSAPSVQPPLMTPQAQHATSVQFNQGNLQHESGTSLPFSSPTVQPPQMPPQSQNGTVMQFNQGNLQHESGASLPFSAPTAQPPQMLPQSQNGTMMQFNQGNFQNGLGTSLPFSVPSVQPPQMRPQSQNGTELPFNQGQPQNQAGPPPAFSAPSVQPAQPYPNTGTPQHPFLPQTSQPPHSNPNMFGDLGSQAGSAMSQAPNVNFQPYSAPSYATAAASQSQYTQALQPNNGTAFPQYGSTAPPTSQFASRGIQPSGGSLPHMSSQMPSASSIRKSSSGEFSQDQGQQTPFGTNDLFGDWAPQSGQGPPGTSQPTVSSSSGALAIVPQASNKKFETKSTVWADTLSRGLVDLNISGPKANPMSDLGIDFDTMNRKEKRMERPKPTPAVSTITMGKAMGSGTGMGRAGASTLRPASNPVPGSGIGMGPGTGMGMVGGHGSGMGMGQNPTGMGISQNPGMGMGMGGGYGSMNPQNMGGMSQGYNNMGMNQGYNNMGMNQGYNNMGMGMGMSQGYNPMQQPGGGQNMPSGYNPMMGAGGGGGGGGGGYPQQPFGGSGYR